MTESSIIFWCTGAFSNKRLKIWNQHFPMSAKQSSSTGHNWKKDNNAARSQLNASSIATGSKSTLMRSAGFIWTNGKSSLGGETLWVVFSNDKQSICQIVTEHCPLHTDISLPNWQKPAQKYIAQTSNHHLHNCLHNDRTNTALKWVALGKFHLLVVYNAIMRPFP